MFQKQALQNSWPLSSRISKGHASISTYPCLDFTIERLSVRARFGRRACSSAGKPKGARRTHRHNPASTWSLVLPSSHGTIASRRSAAAVKPLCQMATRLGAFTSKPFRDTRVRIFGGDEWPGSLKDVDAALSVLHICDAHASTRNSIGSLFESGLVSE